MWRRHTAAGRRHVQSHQRHQQHQPAATATPAAASPPAAAAAAAAAAAPAGRGGRGRCSDASAAGRRQQPASSGSSGSRQGGSGAAAGHQSGARCSCCRVWPRGEVPGACARRHRARGLDAVQHLPQHHCRSRAAAAARRRVGVHGPVCRGAHKGHALHQGACALLVLARARVATPTAPTARPHGRAPAAAATRATRTTPRAGAGRDDERGHLAHRHLVLLRQGL
jgi:hypothetical protein